MIHSLKLLTLFFACVTFSVIQAKTKNAQTQKCEYFTTLVIKNENQKVLSHTTVTFVHVYGENKQKTDKKGEISMIAGHTITIKVKGYKIKQVKLAYEPKNEIVLEPINQTVLEKSKEKEVEKIEKKAENLLFPNPIAIGDETNLRWTLEKTEMVTIKVIDLDGKEVAQVSNTYTKGEHTYSVPTQSLSVGIYLITLNTAEKTTVHKLVVSR